MFNDFKPVLKILLRFILIYLGMVFLYQFYLNRFENLGLDPVSKSVAKQATFVQNILGYQSAMVDGKPQQMTSWFFVMDKYISRMVEGCNAISVMILFLAFIFAFYHGKKTFVFAFIGLIILHVLNVLRIAGLNILLIETPQYDKIGHDYVFPAIIYGGVVVLWLVWIKFFALKTPANETA